MKTPTFQEIDSLRQQGKTFQEIADIYGCSRQNIHQIAHRKPKLKSENMRMKAPTKAELYAQVEALTKENIALQERLDAEEHKRWIENKDKAIIALYHLIPFTMLQVRKLLLDHVDKSGYWFTFNVDNYSERQTFCVRHTDLVYKEAP